MAHLAQFLSAVFLFSAFFNPLARNTPSPFLLLSASNQRLALLRQTSGRIAWPDRHWMVPNKRDRAQTENLFWYEIWPRGSSANRLMMVACFGIKISKHCLLNLILLRSQQLSAHMIKNKLELLLEFKATDALSQYAHEVPNRDLFESSLITLILHQRRMYYRGWMGWMNLRVGWIIEHLMVLIIIWHIGTGIARACEFELVLLIYHIIFDLILLICYIFMICAVGWV